MLQIGAACIGVIGATAFVLDRAHPFARGLGMVGVVVSAYLVRASKKMAGPARPIGTLPTSQPSIDRLPNVSDGPGTVAWILAAVAVIAIIVSYWLMHRDALNGGHQAWPADAFAGSAFFAAIVFGYIGAKLTQRQ